MFIDTHAHLNLDPFYEDVQPYIDRALDAGVSKIIVPSIDLITSERAISLADKYDNIFAAVGVHPHGAYISIANHFSCIDSPAQATLQTVVSHNAACCAVVL